jgi:xanthine dehydrogenase accessory factor
MSKMLLADRAAGLRATRTPFVEAMVVRAERPTSAKPGDSALVLGDGTIEGFVGGTCAETTVRLQALECLASGESVLLRITPDDAIPSGWTDGDGQRTVANPCLSGGTLEIFLEPVVPAPLVAVVGAGPVARALVAAAGPLGFAVAEVVEGGGLPADAAAVVVAAHGRGEVETLLAALNAEVPYVGLVASRRRGEAVVAELPICAGHKSRIHTPAGLDIGARTPAEVALSIFAEIVSLRPRKERIVPTSPLAATTGSAIDVVCGMSVATVPASLHCECEGRTYWFCGSGCQAAFQDDPARYLG